MSATRSHTRIRATRSAVYRALLDADAVRAWRVPDGMRAEIHVFEPVPDGAFRISLTYDAPERIGKTAGRTDTYRGRFLELDPDQRIVEAVEFETDDRALQGEMRIITTLADVDEATELTMLHEGLPPGVRPADNETGTRIALAKLAALLERET